MSRSFDPIDVQVKNRAKVQVLRGSLWVLCLGTVFFKLQVPAQKQKN